MRPAIIVQFQSKFSLNINYSKHSIFNPFYFAINNYHNQIYTFWAQKKHYCFSWILKSAFCTTIICHPHLCQIVVHACLFWSVSHLTNSKFQMESSRLALLRLIWFKFGWFWLLFEWRERDILTNNISFCAYILQINCSFKRIESNIVWIYDAEIWFIRNAHE